MTTIYGTTPEQTANFLNHAARCIAANKYVGEKKFRKGQVLDFSIIQDEKGNYFALGNKRIAGHVRGEGGSSQVKLAYPLVWVNGKLTLGEARVVKKATRFPNKPSHVFAQENVSRYEKLSKYEDKKTTKQSRTSHKGIEKFYLFTDKIEGEDLFDNLNKGGFNNASLEKRIDCILSFTPQLVNLHENMREVHCDLKLDNLMYSPITNQGQFIDYEYAGPIGQPTVVGDIWYLPPDILNDPTRQPSRDMYEFGTVCDLLLAPWPSEPYKTKEEFFENNPVFAYKRAARNHAAQHGANPQSQREAMFRAPPVIAIDPKLFECKVDPIDGYNFQAGLGSFVSLLTNLNRNLRPTARQTDEFFKWYKHKYENAVKSQKLYTTMQTSQSNFVQDLQQKQIAYDKLDTPNLHKQGYKDLTKTQANLVSLQIKLGQLKEDIAKKEAMLNSPLIQGTLKADLKKSFHHLSIEVENRQNKISTNLKEIDVHLASPERKKSVAEDIENKFKSLMSDFKDKKTPEEVQQHAAVLHKNVLALDNNADLHRAYAILNDPSRVLRDDIKKYQTNLTIAAERRCDEITLAASEVIKRTAQAIEAEVIDFSGAQNRKDINQHIAVLNDKILAPLNRREYAEACKNLGIKELKEAGPVNQALEAQKQLIQNGAELQRRRLSLAQMDFGKYVALFQKERARMAGKNDPDYRPAIGLADQLIQRLVNIQSNFLNINIPFNTAYDTLKDDSKAAVTASSELNFYPSWKAPLKNFLISIAQFFGAKPSSGVQTRAAKIMDDFKRELDREHAEEAPSINHSPH